MNLPKSAQPGRIAALLLALPGLVAPFLSFTYFVSPMDTIRLAWFSRGDEAWILWILGVLGAPFFLSIPIATWQARRLFGGRLSAREVAAAYVLSIAAMISTLPFASSILLDAKAFSASGVLAPIIFWALFILANVALLWHTRAKHMASETSAEVFLLGAYLPNAVFCLIGFGGNDSWAFLQIGAWVALIASLGYLISIALTLRTEPRSPASISRAGRIEKYK